MAIRASDVEWNDVVKFIRIACGRMFFGELLEFPALAGFLKA